MIRVREMEGWYLLLDAADDEPIMRFASDEEARAMAMEIEAYASATKMARDLGLPPASTGE